MDQRNLIKTCIKWTLGNNNNISFWHDIWLTDYPLIEKLNSDKINEINFDTVKSY